MGFRKICVALMSLALIGCAHHNNNSASNYSMNSKSDRTIASSPQEIARAYFNLAATLSEARANTGVCESGVYQENIIQALNNARQFEFDNGNIIQQELQNSSNPKVKAIEKQVGMTLSYKLLKSEFMGLGGYRMASKIEDLVENTSFESQGVGAYGHFLEYHFKPNGKIIKKRLTNIDTFPLEWSETQGTWESHGYSMKNGGPQISIRTKYLTGPNKGKNKTELFVIKQTCEYGGCFYGLVPANRIKKEDYYSSPSFRDFRVFDLKTDECDA